MVFSYYSRLTPSQKCEYDKSDEITSVKIPNPSELHALIHGLRRALEKEDKIETERISQKIISTLTARLGIPNIKVKVLAVRPRNSRGELHGLYNPSSGQLPTIIYVWMRTARQKRVIAFKTFLRTILHEFCHHLDYEYLRFTYSFHTEGFYKRESSLFHQLVTKVSPRHPANHKS